MDSRGAGTDAVGGSRALLMVPAVLFALADFACRLQLATLLELHHHEAARAAAFRSAASGAARDVLLVAPAYLAWALLPRPATRWLCHAVLGLAVAILAGDVVYFYFTFEHVEPVLFVNVNLLSVRGTVSPRIAALLGSGALALAVLLRGNAWLLEHSAPSSGSRLPASLVGVGCLAALAPLAIAATPELPPEERSVERFLNETRSAYVARVGEPILSNFFVSLARGLRIEEMEPPPVYTPYTAEERALLDGLQLRDASSGGGAPRPPRSPEIRRIVLLVLESLPAAYLHHYNPAVPAEATPFLDELLRRHPHLDNFYTSNTPSDWGLNSLLLSRLRPDWDGGRPSLLSVLREELGFESYYVRGVSKHYGNELETYPLLFQMDHYFALEELSQRYHAPWRSSWGMNNAVVYEEGIRILREKRDERVALVLKTIDLHQPGPFQGIPRKYLPEALQALDVGLFNALHWVDHCVRTFFEKLESEGLFDDHTLVVVTSDHTPHPGVEYKQTVPPEEYTRLGRLPLIFATREPLQGLDTAGLASQIDLAPTILGLVGAPVPAGFAGRDLGDPDDARSVGVGVYRDRLYYRGTGGSFTEDVAEDSPVSTLRSRAIRKWLRNLDVDPVS